MDSEEELPILLIPIPAPSVINPAPMAAAIGAKFSIIEGLLFSF